MDMLQGDTPWPGWSRAQLFNVCNRISALYEQVELRERTAKELSESTRKEMLKSESRGLRNIRLTLIIARLGPGGGRGIPPNGTNGKGEERLRVVLRRPQSVQTVPQNVQTSARRPEEALQPLLQLQPLVQLLALSPQRFPPISYELHCEPFPKPQCNQQALYIQPQDLQ